jgi:peptidoglycan/LPS O-acetylase OafA/YrhL
MTNPLTSPDAASAREPAVRTRGEFFPRLESLRGIAALMVAAMHTAQSRYAENAILLGDPPDWNHPIGASAFVVYRTVANGHSAVIVFFVLSGFVLAGSIDRGPQDFLPAARRFFTGRVFRLYPAIISTLLIFVLVYWLWGGAIGTPGPEVYSAVSVLRNMLLLDATIDGVMWTLQLEVIALPLIFALTLAQRRFGAAIPVGVALVLVALSFWGGWTKLIDGGPELGSFYAFVFGIMIHRLGPPLFARLRGRAVAVFFFAMVVMFFLARPLFGTSTKWSPLVEASTAAGIIAALAFAGEARFARVLDWPLFRFYGRISYSLYLLHPLTLIVLWKMPNQLAWLLARGIPGVVIAIGLGLVSTAAITPLAWLNWRFIEVPAIAVGRRLLPRKSTPVARSAELPTGATR